MGRTRKDEERRVREERGIGKTNQIEVVADLIDHPVPRLLNFDPGNVSHCDVDGHSVFFKTPLITKYRYYRRGRG